jgi:hypothetical protein
VVLHDRARFVRHRLCHRLHCRPAAHPGRGPLRCLQLGDPAFGGITGLCDLRLRRGELSRLVVERLAAQDQPGDRDAEPKGNEAECHQLDGFQWRQPVPIDEHHLGHERGAERRGGHGDRPGRRQKDRGERKRHDGERDRDLCPRRQHARRDVETGQPNDQRDREAGVDQSRGRVPQDGVMDDEAKPAAKAASPGSGYD